MARRCPSPDWSDRGARRRQCQRQRSRNDRPRQVASLGALDCDAVIIVDADLQDPPECIPEMVDAWRSGSEIVLIRRRNRRQEGFLKRSSANVFYRVIGRMSAIDIPEDVGDFRLLSRPAVEALQQFPERSRFMKGLFAWIGFQSREIEYDRDGRFAGTTKWDYWRLWNFALEGITSFSAACS